LNSDSNLLKTSIPTSFINPAALDLELMSLLEPAALISNYNFDSLFVPFRCIASDIENKKTILFKSGNLNKAVRASMSYPLYLEPLRINGLLLFDGGLYNNFPTDIMRDEFDPEVIIGSNVSTNEAPPLEGDAISQLRNMVVSKTNYELPEICCILIEPEVPYGTFDFKHSEEKVDSGYAATIRQMDSIKAKVHRRVHPKVVGERRYAFNQEKLPLRFGTVNYRGLTKSQSNYVGLILKPKRRQKLDMNALRSGYYRLYNSDKIARIFPTTAGLTADSTYLLQLEIKKEKNILLEFGGNIASRPINTGYLGIGYAAINKTGMSAYVNSYFGTFYNSGLASFRVDIPTRFPIYAELSGILNRWNYYRSRAKFFETYNSLFLIQNESFAKLDLAFALSNKSKIAVGGGPISFRDDYFSTANFGEEDIRDKTTFGGTSYIASFEKNSHNEKQYANAGTQLYISLRYTLGQEICSPSPSSIEPNRDVNMHDWADAKITYDKYYRSRGVVRLGFFAEGVYSSMKLFSNYTSSSLRSPVFQPTPESKTLYLNSFRAYQYIALGHKVIFNVYRKVDLRFEAYVFQPFRYADKTKANIDVNDNGNTEDDFVFSATEYSNLKAINESTKYVLASANAVYKSPFGPLSFSANYYYNVPELGGNPDINPRAPFSFLIHFVYILFNERALK
jgi:NTE family protein